MWKVFTVLADLHMASLMAGKETVPLKATEVAAALVLYALSMEVSNPTLDSHKNLSSDGGASNSSMWSVKREKQFVGTFPHPNCFDQILVYQSNNTQFWILKRIWALLHN